MAGQLVPYSDNESSDSNSSATTDDVASCRPTKLRKLVPTDANAMLPNKPTSGSLAHQGTQEAAPRLQRAFPHQEGAFAFTVFIPVHLVQEDVSRHQKIFDQLKKQVPSLQLTKWSPDTSGGQGTEAASRVSSEQHISVSRTLSLRFAQVDVILSSLKHRFSTVSTFDVTFGGIECLLNDQALRVFVCNMVTSGMAQTCAIVASVNKVVQPHGLQTFHKEPKPHVSFAWTSGDNLQQLQSAIQATEGLYANSTTGCVTFTTKVSSICCQVGQKRHVLWSAPKSARQ